MKILLGLLLTSMVHAQTGTNPMGPKTLGQPHAPNSGMTQSRSNNVMGDDASSASKDSATDQGAGTVPNDKSKKEEEIKLGPYDRDGNYNYRRK